MLVVRARRRRGVLCRRAGRDRDRRRPLSRRGRGRAGRGRLRSCCRRSSDCRKAVEPGAPAVRRELNSNIVADLQGRLTATPMRPSRKAAHVFHEDLWQHRGAGHPIEGRGILAEYPRRRRRITVWASTQKAHDLFQSLIALLDLDESRLRVATPDVGGGFGPKLCVYPEDIAVVAAAQAAAALDQMDRGPARAFHQRGAGARPVLVDRDRGRRRRQVLGMRGKLVHDRRRLRAAGRQHPLQLRLDDERPLHGAGAGDGRHGRATNKTPVSSVRGAGYPQAAFAMERLMDRVARELKLDRAELRRRNLIPPEKMPYTKPLKARSGAAMQYDSGDYPACQAEVLAAARLGRLPARQAAARAAGPLHRHRACARHQGHRPRAVRVRRGAGVEHRPRLGVHRRRRDRARACSTALAQICARASSACAPDDITVVPGDTGGVSLGLGAFASRQTVTAGSSVLLAARAVADKAKKLASHVLEAAEHDLELAGRRGARGRRAAALGQARRARRASSRARPAMAFRPASSPGSKPTSIGAPTRSPMPMPATSPRSRSTSRPAACRSCNYVALQDSGMLINPDDGRRPGARRHRARHRQRALRMDGLRRRRPAGHHDLRRLSAADRDRAADDRRRCTRRRPRRSIRSASRARARSAPSRPPPPSSRRSRMRCSRSACASRRRRCTPQKLVELIARGR